MRCGYRHGGHGLRASIPTINQPLRNPAVRPACLGADTIAEYVDGVLDAAQVRHVDAHIDGCGLCRGDLSALAVASETRQSLGPNAPPRRIDPETIEPGTLLGRFVSLGLLGRGGMGVVVRAYDPELKRATAVKVLRPDLSGLAELGAHDRLRREAQAMARLTHANVVTVYDVISQDDQVFIAMELVEGGTLRDWLSGEHSWRETLDVCLEAGRGLVAAHGAQVIHRDFKPENVLCSDDGRVLVTDFGLAQAIEEAESDAALNASANPQSLVGTPAYMAPELCDRLPATEHSDQFSFCATVYEALYGQRPYRGDTWAELREQQLANNVQPPPEGTRVPKWVRRALCRGLDPAPDKRYASMSALLDALAADPSARRRRLLLVGSLVTLVTVTVVGFAWLSLRPTEPTSVAGPTCAGEWPELSAVWNEATKRRIYAHFATSNRAHAKTSGSRVGLALDRYTAVLSTTRRQACEATHVYGTQSDELLGLRMVCLRRRVEEVKTLVELFSAADAETIDRAAGAVGELTSPAACDDLRVIREGVDRDPAIEKKVQRGLTELARLIAMRLGGTRQQARAGLDKLLASAREIGDPHLLSDVYYQRARSSVRGKTGKGEQFAHQSLWAAQTAGDGRKVARAALFLATKLSLDAKRFTEATRWIAHASAALRRVGSDEEMDYRLHSARGRIAYRNGDYKAALADYDHALKLARRSRLGPNNFLVSHTMNLIAMVHHARRDYKASAEVLEQQLSATEERIGEDHPTLIYLLNNLGAAYERLGNAERAIVLLRRSLALRKATHGPKSPSVAVSLNNIALVLERKKHFAKAARMHREALAIHESAGQHVRAAITLVNLAGVLSEQGNHAAGEKHARRALALFETQLGKGHHYIATPLALIGKTLCRQKKCREAIPLLRRSLRIREKKFGKKHGIVSETLDSLGTAYLGVGENKTAITLIERSLSISDHEDARKLLSRAKRKR